MTGRMGVEAEVLEHGAVQQITRYGLFTNGQRIGLAVSGGADSMCLLHLIHELAPRWNLRLTVLHVEHGIRGAASRADAEFVQQAAADFGLPCRLHSADVPGSGDNLEQAARQIRHEFYSELISTDQLDRIATGHTASDQAETILYRLFRGSGLAGLSGIRPVTTHGVVRPLLSSWRPDIERWLRERNIPWREDASNRDLSFARNRLRHDTIPMLRQAFNLNLDRSLAQLAILAQDEEQYWLENADRISVGVGPAGGPVILCAGTLAQASPALARRQLRHAFERVKGDLRQIAFEHVEKVLAMARAGPGHNRAQLPGLDVIRSFDWIRIAAAGFDSEIERDFQVAVQVPGSVGLLGGGTVTFELIGSQAAMEPYVRVGNGLDWQSLISIRPPGLISSDVLSSDVIGSDVTGGDVVGSDHGSDLLELRNWRPGDHYHPAGQSDDMKLKTLFQEQRVPLWERRHWPVLTCQGQIVWSRRFGPAQNLAGSAGRFPVVRIIEIPRPCN